MSGKVRVNPIGIRFGRLKVLKEAERKKNQRMFLCRCDCGNKITVYLLNIRSGATVSCGCYRNSVTKTHGDSGTPFYRKYVSLKSRCDDPNNTMYGYYGGRGIKCRWDNYESFKNDAYKSYVSHIASHGERMTTIDRVDTNGDYSKENFRWATPSEQMENRRYRPTKFYEFNGKMVTIRELCKQFNINRSMLGKRISMGWNIERAISEPSAKTRLRTSK